MNLPDPPSTPKAPPLVMCDVCAGAGRLYALPGEPEECGCSCHAAGMATCEYCDERHACLICRGRGELEEESG